MLENIRNTVPEVAIRTTFITGYPGETESDFNELMNFVQASEFERLGVFTYSDEEGTAGFNHDQKVPHSVAVERRRKLMLLQAAISKKHNRALIGRKLPVLIDKSDSKSSTGRLFSQAPDIDGIVRVKGSETLCGEFLDVLITGAGEYDLNARPAQQ
jgi:ribosomal protein S12 methylthiotransferase